MRRLSLANSPYLHYVEEDENFRRWVEALERSSILTASVYFRKACYSCEKAGITPREVAKMDPKQAKFFLQDLISHFEKKGVKGSGIEGVKAVKSWMVWNDIDPPKSNRIYGASDYNKYENEVPPTRQELRRILDVAGPNLFITYPLAQLDKFVIGLFVICVLSSTLQGL